MLLLILVALAIVATGGAGVATGGMRRTRLAAAELRSNLAAVEARAALLESTLENTDDGISVFDRDGRLLVWNSRMGELLNISDWIGPETTLREILMVQAKRGDFGEGHPTNEVEERLRRFYHDIPIVKERVTASGQILRICRRPMPQGVVLTVYSDITEIKAWERRLIQTRSQAELANRAKSDFLANMSHELRTPLNAIIGFSQVIADQIFGPIANAKYLEYIKDVHSSSLHLMSIINDVLDMAKIEAGRIELCKEAVNIGAVIGEMVRMLEKRAAADNVELVADLPADDIVLWVDERAIRQMLLNLLANAIKFSKPHGRIDIRVSMEAPEAMVIEVEDHGIGMTDEELQRALQPFGQAQATTSRSHGGTGLGLPITKGLVEAHGGTLTLTSQPVEGTCARIELPVRSALLTGGPGDLPVIPAAPDPSLVQALAPVPLEG